MHTEDEEDTLPILTKWPFYLGDAALVGLAVTIALLDGWQLDGLQVFACVLAVALGAGLLVFPFVMEYQMFAREEKEDRAAELRLLKKELENLEDALLKQHERLKKQESRQGLDDQRYELLTSAIDQKTQMAMPDLSALTKRLEAIEAAGAKEAKVSDAFKKELAPFEESIQKAIGSLDNLRSRVDTLETKAKEASAAAPIEERTATTSKAPVSEKPPKKKEASLLKRAIREKQDQASKAVSRIIDSENKPTVSESEIDQLPDDFSVSLGADLMMDDDLFEAEAKKTTPSKKQKNGATSEKSVLTTVAVNKLMGIGNKPFLRGSGAGLNWEKGAEMEFQEIGKWTWAVTVPVGETVEIQVYRNDKDADRKGRQTVAAGQSVEIVPEF